MHLQSCGLLAPIFLDPRSKMFGPPRPSPTRHACRAGKNLFGPNRPSVNSGSKFVRIPRVTFPTFGGPFIRLERYSTLVDQETHHSLQTCTIPSSSEVAHRPDSRPQSSNLIHTRQCHCGFDISSREAEPIPAADHAALVVQIVSLLLL